MKRNLILSWALILAGAGLLVSLSCNTNPSGPGLEGAVQTVVANNPTFTATDTRTCVPTKTPTTTPTRTSTPTGSWTPANTKTPTPTLTPTATYPPGTHTPTPPPCG